MPFDSYNTDFIVFQRVINLRRFVIIIINMGREDTYIPLTPPIIEKPPSRVSYRPISLLALLAAALILASCCCLPKISSHQSTSTTTLDSVYAPGQIYDRLSIIDTHIDLPIKLQYLNKGKLNNINITSLPGIYHTDIERLRKGK
jgi:hypothetical protein